VHNGVLLAGPLAEVLQHLLHIRVGQDGHQIIHEIDIRLLVQAGAGDALKELLEEGIGLGDLPRCAQSLEWTRPLMVAAGGEEAIDYGLGIHICELRQLLRAVEVGD